MEQCPKCNRLSLDYDPFTKRRRCLYLTGCGYSEELPGRVSDVSTRPRTQTSRTGSQSGAQTKPQRRH